jgi:hypothetical protein
MANRRSPNRRRVVAALLVAPLAITFLRATDSHVADWLNATLTLAHARGPLHHHLQQMLFVPLSAVVVALFRLTLGLRVVGLFRPILLALAFHATGIGPGLALLALALICISAVHPLLRGAHSYSRLAIVLTLVSALLAAGAMVQQALAAFPLIALCLTCEMFANKLRYQGIAEALARTMATLAPAIVIALISGIPGFLEWLLRHPEMLAAEIAAVLIIDGWLNLRLLSAAGRRVPWAPVRLMTTTAEAGGR